MSQCAFCRKRQKQWKDLSFHRFPTGAKLALWVKNMGRQNWIPSKYSVLCSDHFTSNCFDKRDFRTRLRKGSVPSLFDTSNRQDKSHRLCEPLTEENSSDCCNIKADDKGGRHFPTVAEECFVSVCESTTVKHSPTKVSLFNDKENAKITCVPRTHHQQTIIHDHGYTVSPGSFKRKLERTEKLLQTSRKNNKVLKQHVKRLKMTVKSLQSIIQNLKKSNYVCDDKLQNVRRRASKVARTSQ